MIQVPVEENKTVSNQGLEKFLLAVSWVLCTVTVSQKLTTLTSKRQAMHPSFLSLLPPTSHRPTGVGVSTTQEYMS